jgi:hypothetical protein
MSPESLPQGPISADDLARLKAEMLRTDPDYRARVEAVAAERKTRSQALEEAEKPILADLWTVGIKVASVWDLVNTSEPYPEALPVLMKHLERGGYPDRVMESLGRSLAVKPAHPYWGTFRDLYLRASGPGEHEGLAVALAACATPDDFDSLVALLDADTGGNSRIHFLRPIFKLSREHGRDVLESRRSNPLFAREIAALLKRRGGRT